MSKNTRRYFEELDKQLKGRSPTSPEFEALLRSKIGGQFQGLVTPENLEKMYLLGRPEEYNPYGGVNAREFVKAGRTPAQIATKLEKDFSSVLREGERVPEGKTIIGIGRSANPNVFTHELRHELGFSPNKLENEVKNRFYDLVYGSTSYPAYLTNVRRVHQAALQLDPEFKRGKTDADFARRRQMSWYSSDKEKEDYVLKSPYLRELLSPGKEGVSLPSRARNLFSDIVNKNYKLNVSGANARTENLPKDAIELRSKFPFLNFVGSVEDSRKARKDSLTNTQAPPRRRAAGSPRSGEKKTPNQEDLRKLMLAMNPDAEQIEEAVAAAPRVPEAARRLGKGYYEANVEPLLSPIETAKSFIDLGKEFIRSPSETGKTVARAELERLKEASEKPEAAAEYYGGMLGPLGLLRHGLRTDVVRPKNEGLVLNEPMVDNKPLGYTANYLKTARDSVEIAGRNKNLPKEQIDAINEFFDRKAKNYFVKQIGTSDDPLFNAIRQGRLTTPALREPGGIPSYMVRGAQVGKSRTDPATGRTRFYPSAEASEALRDMTTVYDRMTGMRGTVFANQTIGSPEYETLVREDFSRRQPEIQARITDRLIQEGVSPDQITEAVDFVGYKDPKFFKEGVDNLFRTNFVGDPRNPSSGTDIARMLATKPEALSKTLSTSLAKGDVVYDMRPTGALGAILQPSNIVDYLATLPPEKIRNIRFEDAVVGGAKLREKADIKLALFKNIRENKPVPNEVFSAGVSDPVLTFPKESPFAGYTWRRIMTPEAAEIEGAYIGHSVGGYSATNPGMVYDEKKRKNFAEGTAQVYSLRDPRGRPVTTIEVAAPPGERPVVSQVKGAGRATGNKMPEQFDAPVTAFLEFLNPSRVIESDQYLPPMAKAFKDQRAKPGPMRASIGRGQPIGNADVANDFLRRVAEQDPDLAARAAANPQMLEDALRRRAEALQPPPQVRQQGIGQLPNAPQNLPNEGFIQAMLRRLGRGEE